MTEGRGGAGWSGVTAASSDSAPSPVGCQARRESVHDESRCFTQRAPCSLHFGRARSIPLDSSLSLSLSLPPSLPPVFLSRPLSLTRDRYSANDRERGPAPAAGGKPTPFIVVVPDDSLYRRADLAQTRETERRMRPNATRAATVP
jgi:hypothetical protein